MNRWLLARALMACASGVALVQAPASAAHAPAVYVVGGPAAVGEAVLDRVEALLGVRPVRLSGPDRSATAAAVSRAHFPSADTVVVASGDAPADALSAGPAAARHNAPVLLVSHGDVPPVTEAELRRLSPGRILIAGGTAAVSAAVQARLAATGAMVQRASGPDRYATSAALSRVAAPRRARTVFLASGRDFPDAMSAAAPAALRHTAILLTDSAVMTDAVRAELERLRPEEIVVVGGERAVPARLVERLRADTTAVVRRVSGPDRYGTSARVSRDFAPRGADVIYLASGDAAADALTVGAVAERMPGPDRAGVAVPQEHAGSRAVLLSTRRDALPPAVEQELLRLSQARGVRHRPDGPDLPQMSPSPSASPSPSPQPVGPAPAAPGAPAPPPPAPNTAPMAADHTYADQPVFRNVLFVSGGGAATAEASTTAPLKLLDGATDADGDTLTVTALDVTIGTGTATVLDAATGAFSYEPLTAGAHTLTYTVSDGALTGTGTVAIDVDADRVVFVKPGAAGTGTSTDPAGSLAVAAAAGGPGDTILVVPGDGSTLTGGITLQEGQRLAGRAAGVSLGYSGGTHQLLAPAAVARPVLTNAAGAAVTLASGATVEQVAVSQGAQPGITGGANTVTTTIRNTTVTTTSGDGIALDTGTYALSGGVAVTTGTGTALAQTSGVITVSGSANSLSTTGGTALRVTGTTVTGGMALQTVSADGGANAITFSPLNAGTATLNVTGAVSSTSGGVIQNVTGDAVVVTAGTVNLSRMLLRDNDADGVTVSGPSGITLDTVTFDNNGDAPGEHALRLTDVTRPVTISSAAFLDGADAQVRIDSQDVNASFTITDSRFEDELADGVNDAIHVTPHGTSGTTLTVAATTFRDLGGASLRWDATGATDSGTSSLTFRANTITNTAGSRDSSVRVRTGGTTVTNVIVGAPGLGNTFSAVGGAADGATRDASLHLWASAGATLRGVVEANTFTGGTTHALEVEAQDDPTVPLLVTANTFTDPHGAAVRLLASAGAADLDYIVTANTVTAAGDAAGGASAAISVAITGQTACADVQDNDVSTTADGNPDVRLSASGAAAVAYRVAHAGVVTAADVTSRNTLGGAAVVDGDAGVTGNGDTPCAQP